MMMLDVCPSGAGQINEWDDAVNLTSKWAKIAHDYYNSTDGYYNKEQLLVPIVQGGTNLQLREKSALDMLDEMDDMKPYLKTMYGKDFDFDNEKILDGIFSKFCIGK